MLIHPATGCHHREPVGEGHAQVPGTVTAHRVPRQIDPAGIGLKLLLCPLEDFECIETAPVFPVEPVRAAIRGCHDVQARFARVGLGLPDPFHRRAVEGQDQSRSPVALS